MKRSVLIGLIVGVSCVSVGAVTGSKITATLIQQPIVSGNNTSIKQAISYNNTTYVPLREFSAMTGTSVDYKNGIIYIGGGAPKSSTAPARSSTYSRNNPAPIGVSQTVSSDGYTVKHTAEICVKQVIRGEEAWKRIVDTNEFNDEAPEGKEYVLAYISVKALSISQDKKLDISGFDFDAYSGSNAKYENIATVDPDPRLDSSIYAGATTEGWVSFLVNKADSNPKIVYGEKYDGTGGIWFSLK